MYATPSRNENKIQFFLYSPTENQHSHFNATRPSFTMTFNEAKTEWMLVQEKCENCQFSPKHLACCAKQQVACFRHSRTQIGDGIFNDMEVHIPGLYSDESRVIWCSKLGRGNLGMDAVSDTYESQKMIAKMPAWNDEVESLVLDFKGRNVMSSAKNFQLAVSQRPQHVICQYGKIGANTFSLDFAYPFSVIQAFAAAMTSIYWK